ncbi:MAG: SGNH/GDSL hydrolase family protein [Alicyclobacillus sp.]|nr:SGNH/GDSL hydrolase family protein [Alicyclobacillus sp.]
MPRNIYLALGDAITAGQGASHPGLGFVHHVSQFLKSKSLADRSVIVAQPGLTAKQLFHITTTLRPTLWDGVAVATICMGSADFARLLRPRRLRLDGNPFPPRAILKKADEFGYHTDQLFRLVHAKQIPHVLVTTLYNPFPSFAPSGQFIEGMNSILRDCATYYQFELVDIEKGFVDNEAYLIQGYRTGGWMDWMTPLNKPILPNNAGHRLIAHLIEQHLQRTASDAARKSTRTPARRQTRSVRKQPKFVRTLSPSTRRPT